MHRALGLVACLSILLATPTGCDKSDAATASPEAPSPEADPVESAEPDVPVGDIADADASGGDEGVDTASTPDEPSEDSPPAAVASNDDAPDEDSKSDEAAGASGGAKKPDGPPPLPNAKYTKVDSSCGKDPGVGQKLKSFKLKSVDGKTMTNRTWGSKVLLVNFWGTWCKPCLKELPEFARLYRRYRKHGLVLVAIATDEDPQAVKSVLKKSRISAKVAVGGESYAGKYNSPKFPFTFVVDPKGNIKSSFRGFEPKCMGKLEADIRAELEARNAK